MTTKDESPQAYRAVKTYHEGKPVYVQEYPAQLTWVGLTDEEIWAMDAYTMAITDQETQWLYRLARAVEAKLKEKNT